MTDKYMIDSSAWIQYFRHDDYERQPTVKKLLEKDLVCINGVIQCELLKGARSEKNYRALMNGFNALHYLDIDRRLWDCVSEAAFELRRKGVTVPMTDLIIAIQCVENHLVLLENDKHFKLIREHFDLTLFE